MTISFENDQILGAYLKDLKEISVFQAQVALEQRFIDDHIKSLQNLKLGSPGLELEYVKHRSMLDAIRQLQNQRENLIETRKLPPEAKK